ncbi:MAG: hypothetical protein K0U86_12900 [Planctomycetes bacterium]|nr:hypothetical protein [Planctomycetota bacterium]MCH9725787.1 hypothetical protein [Planctomycetota bacterium]MCH9777842.1 hypothetical protein [Planctomycetota bacterium]MCH9791015.1 hypothetical protein [Planctomycetota bacterium]MDF1742582.1 hypothetical protein [Gimesia sp.]
MTPLHHIGNFIRDLVVQIPLWCVRALFLGTLIAVFLWVLRLPRETTTPDNATHWYQNLKIWACLALAIQIVIYSIF